MIPLIKYNEPTITNRIYRRGCILNVEDFKDGGFFIDKPNGDEGELINLRNVIICSKIIENENVVYLDELRLIETDENIKILELFGNKKIGIGSRAFGTLNPLNNEVENVTLLGANLILNPEEANLSYNFEFLLGKRIILEFITLDEERYNTKNISKNDRSNNR